MRSPRSFQIPTMRPLALAESSSSSSPSSVPITKTVRSTGSSVVDPSVTTTGAGSAGAAAPPASPVDGPPFPAAPPFVHAVSAGASARPTRSETKRSGIIAARTSLATISPRHQDQRVAVAAHAVDLVGRLLAAAGDALAEGLAPPLLLRRPDDLLVAVGALDDAAD